MDIIQNQSSSFDEILSDLKKFVQSNSSEAFKNFTSASAGGTVMELIAGLGAFLHHDVMTARRESILETTRLRSSLMGMAQLMGYPVRRKSSPKLKMIVRVDGNAQIPISRFRTIGTFRSLSISPLRDYILQPGLNEIYCAIGTWKTHSFSLDRAGDFAKYLIRNNRVENDLVFTPRRDAYAQKFDLLELWVTPQERVGSTQARRTRINLVEYAEQMDENSCQIKTHLDGIVLSFGDGTFGRRAFMSDSFEFVYLETDGLVSSISATELGQGFNGTVGQLTDVSFLSPGANEDDNEKIRIALTSYNATRRNMITMEDHKTLLLSYPGVVSANAQQTEIVGSSGCCSVDLTCLMEDGHRLDESTSEVIESGTIPLSENNVFFQSSDVHPSSIMLPQTGFTMGLTSGVKVWIDFTPIDETDAPQGITSGQFYHIIRIPGTLHIRLATSKINALLGIYCQINPPSSGGLVNGLLGISVHQDTTKTKDPLGDYNIIYETDFEYASSLRVPSDFLTNVSTGDQILVTYSDGANKPSGLTHNAFFGAIKITGENRLQFATDSTRAIAGDRVSVSAPSNGQPASGTVTLDRLRMAEEFVLDPSKMVLNNPENPLEPGYMNIFGSGLAGIISEGVVKVRLRSLTGGTVLPGGLANGGVYWIYNPSNGENACNISFATSRENADPSDNGTPRGIPLTNLGSSVTGRIALDVFYPENTVVSITPSSKNLVYESAYAYSSTLDLTENPFWVNDIGAEIYTGMKVRLYSDGSATLPDGLTLGNFYYLIPIPGTTRVRFAQTREDAVNSNYIELSPPSVGTIGGYLLMDFFIDASTFPLSPTNLFYHEIGGYLSSINTGRSMLTGTTNSPYGYPTGTKLQLVADVGAILPGGLESGSFYYLIRVAGTNNIRFALTRSQAMKGVNVQLANDGSTPSGNLTVKVYATPEEDQIRGYLEQFRVAGEQIHFVDPVSITLEMKMTVVISSAASFASVQTNIRSIISEYTNKLSGTFYLGDIYKRIQNLDNVLRIYVEKPNSDYQLSFNEYFVLPGGAADTLFDSDHIRIVSGEKAFVDLQTLPSTSDGYGD